MLVYWRRSDAKVANGRQFWPRPMQKNPSKTLVKWSEMGPCPGFVMKFCSLNPPELPVRLSLRTLSALRKKLKVPLLGRLVGTKQAGCRDFSWAGPQTSRSEIWAFTQLRHTTTIHYTSFSIHKQGMEPSSSRSSCRPQFSTTDPIQKLSYLREIHRHVSSTTLKSLKNTYACEIIQCIYIYIYIFIHR